MTDQAPSINDLADKAAETKEVETADKVVPVRPSTNISVNVIGCGGCGKRRAAEMRSKQLYNINFMAVDTADGDISKLDIDTYIVKGSGSGSGQHKATNIDAIVKSVNSELFDNTRSKSITPADINIVIFSLSGGSGSLIGPMIIKELKRRGKVAIAVCVSDTVSELSTKNSYKTLLSLEHMVSSEQMYLPIMVFSNHVGRPKADIIINDRLHTLFKIITTKADDLDKNDKINFFKPDVLIDAPPKLASMRVFQHTDDYKEESGEITYCDDDTHIYDAVMHITPDLGRRPKAEFRSIFVGHNVHPSSEKDEYMCLLGYPLPEGYLSRLQSSMSKYDNIANDTKETFENKGFKSHSSGQFI